MGFLGLPLVTSKQMNHGIASTAALLEHQSKCLRRAPGSRATLQALGFCQPVGDYRANSDRSRDLFLAAGSCVSHWIDASQVWARGTAAVQLGDSL